MGGVLCSQHPAWSLDLSLDLPPGRFQVSCPDLILDLQLCVENGEKAEGEKTMASL